MQWNRDHPAYLLGVEEELMLVDERGDLTAQAPQLLADHADRHLQEELLQSMIEVTTPPVVAQECAQAIQAMRLRARALAKSVGCDIASCGSHPTALAVDQQISAGDHYHRILDRFPQIREQLVFGLHVHVCIPDPDLAVVVHRALSDLAPQFIALSASSALWRGKASGMASTRAHTLRMMPRTGPAPAYADWGDYQRQITEAIEQGEIPKETWLWHDVRLQPRYGTVEVRAFDAQPCWRDSAALACLVHEVARIVVTAGEADYDPVSCEIRRHKALTDGHVQMTPLLEQAISQLPVEHRKRVEAMIDDPFHVRQATMPASLASMLLAPSTTS
jgi:carboxylate-amine ligase